MKKFFLVLACLMAISSINAFAEPRVGTSIDLVGTTYQTKDIVGSWYAKEGTNIPCYTCKIKNAMFAFVAGANVAQTALKKAKKVHVLRIQTSEQRTVKVFKRRANSDSYVIMLGDELFYFEEGAKSILRCSAAFLNDTRELPYATLKHSFLIAEDNALVLYD